MIIRKYVTSDCNNLANLFYDTVHNVNVEDYSVEQLNVWATGKVDLDKWNESFLEHYTVVAMDNGIIVGFGDIDKTGYLDRLYVHKDYLKNGIATAICNELEGAIDTTQISTHASITAKPFFEKRGYKVIKKQHIERDGIILINYVMSKQVKENKYKIFRLDKRHLNDFIDMRMTLFNELGEVRKTTDITQLRLSTTQYFLSNIEENLLCWAIQVDDKIVSIASLNLFTRIPYLDNLSGREGYILNIYTRPNYRKRGLAGRLVNAIIDYAKENEIKRLWLNSSEQGKSVYISHGFEEVENVMELYLR